MDYISEAKQIVDLLKAENYEEYANKILDAIKGACTGSEILFGVNFYLSEAPKNLKPETMTRINNLIRVTNLMLKKHVYH